MANRPRDLGHERHAFRQEILVPLPEMRASRRDAIMAGVVQVMAWSTLDKKRAPLLIS